MEYFTVYVLRQGEWQEYTSFKDRRGYATLVEEATKGRLDAAAKVLHTLILENVSVQAADLPLVMRALRAFDEVGLSNDIHAAFDEIDCEGDFEAVAVSKARPEAFAAADFSGLSI
ncbi:MAG: hypothetical protein IJX81_05945 [Clostridia bacterium]|nr:hypothetical protein [Clostridia bacterium]